MSETDKTDAEFERQCRAVCKAWGRDPDAKDYGVVTPMWQNLRIQEQVRAYNALAAHPLMKHGIDWSSHVWSIPFSGTFTVGQPPARPDWQERVIQERADLHEKIEKLETYLTNSDDRNQRPWLEVALLRDQVRAMFHYEFILDRRIKRF